ncbi:MAG: toxic anion resistance protein [Clostridiales bacterium]|nr:toxic anion resistance protein [Clostridiales bacterium]
MGNEMELHPAPELVLDGSETIVAQPVQDVAEVPKELDDSMLSEEERGMVAEFAEKIDLTNTNQVLMYGAQAQNNISSFSQSALDKVRAKDLGEVGGMLSGLVTELKGFSFDEPEAKGLKKMFKKSANSMSQLKARYDSVEKNIDKICDALESHRIQLMKDIAMLDQLYQTNLAYYKELTMYILAGRQKLAQVRQNDLEILRSKAQAGGLPEDAQAVSDLENMCTRFEKKLHDLDLTRTISIQMAPQIRLIQNNDSMMVEKLQSTLINTIPLWKNQMVLVLGLQHSKEAMEAQRQVTDMTNELLRRNADALKQGSAEVAKESERGIVDVETLQYANESLIATLDEVIQIQAEGRQRRQDAESELRRVEEELKQKLLEAGK